MILILKSGNVTCCAQNWSAGADEGDRVTILAHNATIGLRMTMQEFTFKLMSWAGLMVDLRDLCETQQETMDRLAKIEAGRIAIQAATKAP